MGSTFIQSIVMITDSSFLSRYNTDAFDAAGNAGLIYVTVFIALIGMGDASQILMARRIGQQKDDLLARIFSSTIVSNLILASILFLILQTLLPSLISHYSAHEEIRQGQIEHFLHQKHIKFFFLFEQGLFAMTV